MSLIRLGVVKLVALLVFFSVFAVAQITEPICTQPSYAWVGFRQYFGIFYLVNALRLDVQLCRPKSVHGHGIHDGNMQRG